MDTDNTHVSRVIYFCNSAYYGGPPRSQTYMFQSRIVPCTVFLLQVLAPRFWEFFLSGGGSGTMSIQFKKCDLIKKLKD